MITKMREMRENEKTFSYICKKCDFYSNNRTDFVRHCSTRKHNDNKMITNDNKKTHNKKYDCLCGKSYKFRSGLSRHKNKCPKWTNKCPFLGSVTETFSEKCVQEHIETQTDEKNALILVTEDVEKKDIFLGDTQPKTFEQEIIEKQFEQMSEMKSMFFELIQTNKDLQDKLVAIAKEPKTVTNNYKTNNQFNIMNYLNNECKNAVNLTDFINQLKYTFKDLLKLTDNGWVANVQETFVQQLREMDQNQRPIHCSDKKRKKFYVKDQDVWEKDEDNTKVLHAINQFQTKQCSTYLKWKNANRDKIEKNDDLHDTSLTLHLEVCKPSCDEGIKMKQKVMNSLTDLIINKNAIVKSGGSDEIED